MRPFSKGHDDSAYGGQNFDAENNKVPGDAAAPKLQLNRKGVGMLLVPNLTDTHLHIPPALVVALLQQLLLVTQCRRKLPNTNCTQSIDAWLLAADIC